MKLDVRNPRVAVYALGFLAWAVGIAWGLPGSDTWAADSVSPRAAGLFAIAETYIPGHFHVYPPLHTALLTALSLPAHAYAAIHSGTDVAALENELIQVGPMTYVEVMARLVALAMFMGILRAQMNLHGRLFGERAAVIAGLVVACNPVLVYYAHTGNLDLPALFWASLAVDAIDRLLSGERCERSLLLLAVATTLTKDQAAGLLVVPLTAAAIARPGLLKSARTWKAVAFAVGVFAVASGLLVNPSGYAKRLAFLFGPGSKDWAEYPATMAGRLDLAKDLLLSLPRYGSTGLACAAAVGVGVVVRKYAGLERLRRLLPLLAAVSFTLLFSFGARRSDDRFVLPQSLFLLPYAAVTLALAWEIARVRRWVILAAAACFVPVLLGVASVDATLLADGRYKAEQFLRALPTGTRVEFHGGPHFLPRTPGQIVGVRVGEDPVDGRDHLPGLAELAADSMQIGARRPDYVVLSAELTERPPIPGSGKEAVTGPYSDPSPREFLRALKRGDLGYDRVLDARCELPWPLECRTIHSSTGLPIWIYRRRDLATGT